MNIKKYLFIAIGTFVVIIILAVGISARFSFSNLSADPYLFIESFFIQWSPALGAAGVFIAAIIALLAIYEGRRSYKLAILDQQYNKIEEWIRDIAEALNTFKHVLDLVTFESKRKQELESEKDSLERKRGTLERETNTEGTEANERLKETTRELIDIDERSINYAKEGIEELVKISSKVARSNITIKPTIYWIGDRELLRQFENFTNLTDEKAKTLETVDLESSPNIFKEAINEIENTVENLLMYIYYLRNKMVS